MSEQDLNIKRFSENLRYLIKKNNLKNVDLANQLELSKGAISNYIKGSRPPSLDNVIKIANYFDVSIDWLINQKTNELNIAVGEEGKLIYQIPLFHKQLNSDNIVYRSENYNGVITSPVPAEDGFECYAIMSYDNSMKSFWIVSGSIVIFSAASEVCENDIAAVLIKSKKQIFIRSVNFKDKKIELTSDNGTEIFKITKDGCDAVVLGKVVFATFFPNNNK